MNANLSLVRTIPPSPALALLATLPALASLSRAASEDLARRATLRRLERGDVLWSSGAAAPGLCVVRSGAVALVRPEAEGGTTLDLVGRGSLVGLGPVPFGARAHDDASVVIVARSELEAWLGEHPEALPAVLALSVELSGRLGARIALLTRHGAKSRLARQLLDLAARFGVRDSRGTIVDVRLTHRELADLIGSTRETVSVAVIELREAGLIATESRRVVVVDEAGLARLVDA